MISVVDVFAGPGGLNEGFAQVEREGRRVFNVVASFEMEPNAVETLVVRSAVRRLTELEGGKLYRPYRELLAGRRTFPQLKLDQLFSREEENARRHVHQIELGPDNRADVAGKIRRATANSDGWVLIGGPPCQAYSLVGRARRTNDGTFAEDKKHFLYREYLDILRRFEPSVFVMENVKGLLSAGHSGESMMQRILEDLRLGGLYDIRSLVAEGDDLQPEDFVIQAEDYGVPQRRHRVILVGVRRGVGSGSLRPLVKTPGIQTVSGAIRDLPAVRSRVSRTAEPGVAWLRARELARALAETRVEGPPLPASMPPASQELRSWLRRHRAPVSQHEPRAHMELDLARYAYLATLAAHGQAPRVADFPEALRPKHKNLDVAGTPFTDRFKVQAWQRASSTVVSHISKDGHYYIHPDANQMRSLTVREAARLQTFPDDYWFQGPRTMQFHQVGNAVPPLLALKIAEKVADLLGH